MNNEALRRQREDVAISEENAINPSVRHEGSEINLRVLAFIASAFGIMAVVIHFALLGLWAYFAANDQAARKTTRTARTIIPPAPRLQAAPDEDELATRAAQMEHLRSYGWINRSRGLAHIPVERAMEITAHGASQSSKS